MFRSKYLALVAACAAMSVGSAAMAADPVLAPIVPTCVPANQPPYLMDDTTMPAMSPNKDTPPASAPEAAPTARPLLMEGFDAVGVGKALDAANITIGGYVEGSWTYSAHPPAGNVIGGRAFDTKSESIQFDAVDLQLTRTFDTSFEHYDFGFEVETMYGWDPAYFHSNGLSIYSPGKTASPIPGAGSTFTIHPKAQFDLTQAYAQIVGPIGNGLEVQFGKFDTLLGYEVIDSNASEQSSHPITFFSRSFIFQEEPFTHTGIIGIYNLTKPTADTQFTVTGGISRGWDQATNDDNGSIDYIGQLKYVSPKLSLTLSGITGQEEPTPGFGFAGLSGYRTVLDFDAQYAVADNFTLAADLMYGWENQTSEGGNGGGVGIWYAAAVYASFKQSDYVTFNIRGEWFDDQDGAAPTEYLTSGFNGTYGKAIGTPNQYYEATVNANICPFPSNPYLSGLHIRPEFRWDYSDHAAWNGATQHDQWTGAIEAYFTF
jgi:hypothetical protein